MKLTGLPRAIIYGLYLFFIFTCIAISDVIMTLSIPVLFFSRSIFRKITNSIASFGWPLFTFAFETFGRNKIVWSGEPIHEYQEGSSKGLGRDRNALVTINHTYYCDWLLSFSLGERCGRIGNIKIAMKDVIKYIPFVGVGIWAMGFIFLSRKWQDDQKKINQAYSHLKTDGEPFWFVTHPEGSRVNATNVKKSQEFAKERGLPILNNVLLPRVKGFTSSVLALRDNLDAVYDLTVAYKKRPAGFLALFFGSRPTEIHVHLKRFPIQSLPTEEKHIEQWLYQRSKEKDILIQQFKDKGYFSEKPLDLPFNPKNYLINFLVWLLIFSLSIYSFYYLFI
ncbi:hypothetical protein CYY_005481 [Polysphondylium violaceum]|uniref:Phospholipid/glycerol acyltransferase domain-containing protein n=1 Tax=Polysphondylium violaceum TaxID=133409 RepID=A0A8J4V6T5_9MYCE|nr:hypothetical protein CYY_005481 [Polysphondylium violaceum]